MRHFILTSLTLALLIGLPNKGDAQLRKKVEFENVQIGFGGSKPLAKFKSGFWTPVYIYVKGGPKGSEKPGELVIESGDSDEVRSRYTVAMPQLEKDEVQLVIGYTRPARQDFSVTAKIDGRVIGVYQEDTAGLEPSDQLFLTLGSRLPSLWPALGKKEQQVKPQNPNPLNPNQEEEQVDENDYRRGPRQVVGMEDVAMFPNRWFAYEPIDCVILTTGRRDFMTNLLNEREGRKDALIEWVRRGGKLIVSVSKNQDLLRDREFENFRNMLPVEVAGNLQVPQLARPGSWAGAINVAPLQNMPRDNQPRAPLDIAKLEGKPGRDVDWTDEAQQEQKKGIPLIVRGAYGLGSVTVVAFDLDERPFKGWNGQQAF